MGIVKEKWFYEGYIVFRDRNRMFHKVVVRVPVEEWVKVNTAWVEEGYRMLEINVRRERWLG